MVKERDKTGFRESVTQYKKRGLDYYSEKKVLKNVTKEIHDFKPDYIFLTETSATPWGYVLKEAYRKAYPNQELPKFYRIDPTALSAINARENSRFKDKGKEKLESFLKKRIIKGNSRVVIFDEMYGRSKSTREVEDSLVDYGINRSNISIVLPKLKRGGIEMWPYIKLTSKKGQGTESYPILKSEEDIRFTGKLIRGNAKGALDYIHEAKEVGREIGEEIMHEEKKKSLEDKVSEMISIVSLFGALFFLSSNITGNAIGNLTNSTSSLIGGVLLLTGLITTFILLKNKKRLHKFKHKKLK